MHHEVWHNDVEKEFSQIEMLMMKNPQGVCDMPIHQYTKNGAPGFYWLRRSLHKGNLNLVLPMALFIARTAMSILPPAHGDSLIIIPPQPLIPQSGGLYHNILMQYRKPS